ncbi:MAG: sodium:proline symporter [Lentisphaerae bacterium]|nr:sodium:proline symporter [Lentisphaerota bacterium]
MIWIDWMIVLIPLLAVIWIGVKTQSYMTGVSDFLAAGRVAGRYVVAVAAAEAGLGLISVVALFEMYYKSGFAVSFWSGIATPVGLLMTLTGFAIYRFRETRAMTMAQFFEARYSKPFRVFAGTLAWISGVVNYALFPAVGGRFLVYYCQFPDTVSVLGLPISTYGLVMALALIAALIIVVLGGQITTMVTDCVQGIFSYFAYAVLVIFVISYFRFDQFKDAFMTRGPGESFLDPFDTGKLTEFNILYVAIGILSSVYNRISWQGSQAYSCAAASPHEQKMGGVLGTWRGGFTTLMITLLALGAYTYLNHPDFASGAAEVRQELTTRINFDAKATTETIRTQMQVPIALRHILPVGVTGLFCALMIFLMVSTDTTYLHSWGSILVQDMILPLRRKPFTPTQQILLLRLSIIGVAVFAWFFSFYFGQVTFILMFFAMTGAIWLGGAGAVIIGGLYWKKGTSAGAWCAMTSGSLLGLGGFLCQKFWSDPIYPWLEQHAPDALAGMKNSLEGLGARLPFTNWVVGPDKFPLSGQEVYLITMLVAVTFYVVVSLLTCREDFNLDRMLHRGEYAREDKEREMALAIRLRSWKQVLIGIDAQYTRGDRILAWSVFIWTMYNFAMFLVIIVWNLFIFRWPREFWFSWWKWYTIPQSFLIGAVTTVWFTIGGTRDLMRLFQRLDALKRDALDDGRVVGGVNADDVAMVQTVERQTAAVAEGVAAALNEAKTPPGAAAPKPPDAPGAP